MDETLFHRPIEQVQKRFEEATDIKKRARLLVDRELRPGEDLHELLQRAVTARQGHEPVRDLRHERFALVHGTDHAQLRETLVADLLLEERLRDHADYLPVSREGGVGSQIHEPHLAAAVDEAHAPVSCGGAESLRHLSVNRAHPLARAAKDANALHKKAPFLLVS